MTKARGRYMVGLEPRSKPAKAAFGGMRKVTEPLGRVGKGGRLMCTILVPVLNADICPGNLRIKAEAR